MHLILRIMANCVAIIISAKYITGFDFTGSPVDLLIAGVVIGLINALIKPIIQLISLPVVILTLGLFNIIINIILLLIADRFLSQLTIQSFAAAFWSLIIFSLVNFVISHLSKPSNLNKY